MYDKRFDLPLVWAGKIFSTDQQLTTASPTMLDNFKGSSLLRSNTPIYIKMVAPLIESKQVMLLSVFYVYICIHIFSSTAIQLQIYCNTNQNIWNNLNIWSRIIYLTSSSFNRRVQKVSWNKHKMVWNCIPVKMQRLRSTINIVIKNIQK